MLVRDVLKAKGREVVKIGPDATVAEALALLVPQNIGSLPVVDGDGRLVGIFTERDVLRGVQKDCSRFLEARIADVMTPDPITCRPDDVVHDVMGKVTAHQIGQLPVVAGDELIGVVSAGDLIKTMFQRVDSENQHLMAYLYGPG